MNTPTVAIAHDYLTQRGGAERVVLAMSRAFPEATIYTTLYNPETTFPEFRGKKIVVSPLNRIGLFRKEHRLALPLLAWASGRVRPEADVVLVSSSGWAHGFPTAGRSVVYCHSPARWLYAADDYLGGSSRRSLKGVVLETLRKPLLAWDKRAAATADLYVANARVIAERIKRAYGLEVEVVPPPFGISDDGTREPIPEVAHWAGEPFELVVSRLMPYKNVDKVIEAVRGTDGRLLVVGSGPMAEELKAGLPDNVVIVSGISDEQLRWAYANCRALVAASYEDFGLTPLEGGSFGKPVLALHAGGYLDTVVEGVNGTFFETATAVEIADGIARAAGMNWDPGAIRAHVETFNEQRFADRLHALIAGVADRHVG